MRYFLYSQGKKLPKQPRYGYTTAQAVCIYDELKRTQSITILETKTRRELMGNEICGTKGRTE